MVNIFDEFVQNDSFIQLKPSSKVPVATDWINNGRSFSEVCSHNGNVGLLTGEASGILDVDLDCSEAVALADAILPTPHIKFDRNTSDSGHFLYKASSFGKTKRFTSTENKALIELRGNGAQTMVPPSKHECGDQLEIKEANLELPPQHYDDLLKCVALVAAAASACFCCGE